MDYSDFIIKFRVIEDVRYCFDLIRNAVAFSLKSVYIKIFITLLNTYHGQIKRVQYKVGDLHEQNPSNPYINMA